VSGPKGGSYVVVSAEELERRALSAARDRYARVAQECVSVAATLKGLGDKVPAVASSVKGDSAAVASAANELERRTARMRERITEIRVALAIAALPKVHLTLTFNEPAAKPGAKPAASAPRTARPAAPAVKDQVALAQELVSKALAVLGPDAAPGLTRKLTGVVAAKGPDQQRITVDDLRITIQGLRKTFDLAQKNESRREQVLVALDGCEGADARELRSRITRVPPGGSVPVSLAHATAVAAAERAHRDALFVQDAVADVLAEIGYRVEDSMAVTVADEGLLLELPGHAHHVARLSSRGDQLRFNVIRVDAEANAGADTAAEVTACEVFADVRAALRKAGVAWDVTRMDPPGATVMASASATPTAVAGRKSGGAKRRKTASVAREINR
jgi:hypothetical protein